jgi:hypothetical protein
MAVSLSALRTGRPLCLDKRLIDGGKFVSLTHWPLSTPQTNYFSASGIRILVFAE